MIHKLQPLPYEYNALETYIDAFFHVIDWEKVNKVFFKEELKPIHHEQRQRAANECSGNLCCRRHLRFSMAGR